MSPLTTQKMSDKSLTIAIHKDGSDGTACLGYDPAGGYDNCKQRLQCQRYHDLLIAPSVVNTLNPDKLEGCEFFVPHQKRR